MIPDFPMNNGMSVHAHTILNDSNQDGKKTHEKLKSEIPGRRPHGRWPDYGHGVCRR
ncbi:hypothetical protein CCP4SC76_6090006 [Gammaproteobacteria bacterium]